MDRHSKFVKFLTIALPLLAMGFLFAVFFFDWSNDDAVQSQFSAQDSEFSEDTQAQVQAPTINSKTEDGDEISMSAQSVEQAQEGADIIATDLEGDLMVGGSDWQIQSDEGTTDSQGRMAEFRGRVMALIDGQYNLLGSQIVADVTERSFQSDFPIEVRSKGFDLNADSGTMTGSRGTRVIELKGNIKGVIRFGEN